MAQKPHILKAATLPEPIADELASRFEVHVLPDDVVEAESLLAAYGGRIRGLAVRKTVIDQALIDRLPVLEVISSYSAGTENIDTHYARTRGIEVANTSHILADEVANLALGQILALTRGLVDADRFVRAGNWLGGPFPLMRSIKNMRIGIVGFGHIGAEVARRLTVIGAKVGYSGPNRKPVDLPYFASALELAHANDMLVVTCPLTPNTTGMINAEVLDALGPAGYLVNVARGPIVDEAALIRALAMDKLAGAALDVFVDEPRVPQPLIDSRRVLLSPHMASGTVETRQFMGEAMVDALIAKLGAEPIFRS